jgi:hypothetical protein
MRIVVPVALGDLTPGVDALIIKIWIIPIDEILLIPGGRVE